MTSSSLWWNDDVIMTSSSSLWWNDDDVITHVCTPRACSAYEKYRAVLSSVVFPLPDRTVPVHGEGLSLLFPVLHLSQ